MMRMAPVAMSCRRLPVRWRASFATRRSSAPLHNLLKNPSPLRGWATAPYTFTTTDNTPSPCRHGGQGSAISYAPGTHPCRRFASLTPSNLRFARNEAIHLRQIYVRFNYVECKAFVSKKEKHIHFISSYLSGSKRLQSTTNV